MAGLIVMATQGKRKSGRGAEAAVVANQGGGTGQEAGDDLNEDWSRAKARRLDELIRKVESKLEDREFKASVSDFVRLLQLRKEIEEERPKEITVTWVEPSEKENAPA